MNAFPESLEIGYDIPAKPGMSETDIQTPCLLIDLDALEHNIVKLKSECRRMGVHHRLHGKMHKSVDIARLQMDLGGAVGICCQKVSEAEAFVRGGILDVLISNQVRDPVKIDRLARLPLNGAKISVCVDDPTNVPELSAAAVRHGTTLDCLVELDCGAGRCGVSTVREGIELAMSIRAARGLNFVGLQAYNGTMQHLESYADRKAQSEAAVVLVREAVAALASTGLDCAIVSGGGTGSYELDGSSGIYTELQCGSYAFMDADYGRILDQDGQRLDQGHWKNALFLLTSIMSCARTGLAVCDAGLKSQTTDSGLPTVYGRADVHFIACNDEHGLIEDSAGVLKVNDRLRLVPGHCDPTCNLHDWYVGVRAGRVEALWPVSARGKAY